MHAAREKEGGHVRGSDEHDQTDRTKHEQQRLPHASHALRVQWSYPKILP
jgi:hypothetical protein